jgi:hypothetical protein
MFAHKSVPNLSRPKNVHHGNSTSAKNKPFSASLETAAQLVVSIEGVGAWLAIDFQPRH